MNLRTLLILIGSLFFSLLFAAPHLSVSNARASRYVTSAPRAAINQPPVAVDDGPYTIHNSALLVPSVMANDYDPDGDNILFDVIVQPPAHGALSFGDNNTIYYNGGGYIGPDSFTYRIRDSFGLSAVATASINAVNQAPVAVDDHYSIRGLQQLLPSVLANDFDPDSQDYLLFDVVVQYPTHGSLSLGGNGTDVIYYNPAPGYVGDDSFTYKMTDNLALRSNV